MHINNWCPDISVVIPVFNEEQTIIGLYEGLKKILERIPGETEIIFVNDGSTDGSLMQLKSLLSDHRIKIIEFTRNFGQHAALLAGFREAKGEVILTMDADLQNNPDDIIAILNKIEEGYEVVRGYRAARKASVFRRIPSVIINGLFARITGFKQKDVGCGLGAFRKDTIHGIETMEEMQKYIPIFMSWRGSKMAEVQVSDVERSGSSSRYSFIKLLRLTLDLLLIFTTMPIQLFLLSGLGIIGILFGFAICFWLTIQGLITHQPLSTNLLILGVLLIFGGFQFISLSLLNERISRIYQKVHGRPNYIIRKVYCENE